MHENISTYTHTRVCVCARVYMYTKLKTLTLKNARFSSCSACVRVYKYMHASFYPP